ncbi:MAG TPA: histidine kinase [Chthoniobacterales bacterium]|nr:histidine kinase [Chthoniobacterales bacterium]
MIGSWAFAMDTILNEVCVLVTVAFALTLLPGLRRPERSLLSRRDQGTALLVFLFLGLVEEATVSHAGLLNERIVAVCAAGLVAGPWVGLAVAVFVTWLAVEYHALPLGSIAPAMLCGGLAGGWLYHWRPKLAQHPLTGFCLTSGVSLLRSGLLLVFAAHSLVATQAMEEISRAPLLQGLGTALILAIIARVRDRDEQTRAGASAEIRALQTRMNPHFLFNALNAVAALATVAPREVPRATGRLRQFLQASFAQPERTLVTLEEELAVVGAYLEIESLRFGDRLQVEQTTDSGLLKVLVPPFSFQPVVENAIEHGLHSSPGVGRLRLVVRATGPWLEMSVTDNGQGVASTEVEQLFFAERPQVHALMLLRRRLQGLFGRSFRLEARSHIGEGTTVSVRIPLHKQFGVGRESLGGSVLLHK